VIVAWDYLDKRTATIDALKDYSSMEYIMQHHQEISERIRDKKSFIPSATPTGMPRNFNPRASESCMIAQINKTTILEERFHRAREYMRWFNPAWNCLTEGERFVLTEFYLKENAQEDAVNIISEKFSIERSSAYKRKNRALDRLTVLLYGR